MIETIGSLSLLSAGSIYDIRTKKVPFKLLAVGTLAGFFFLCHRVWANMGHEAVSQLIGESLGCLAPGLLLMVLSLITEKKVGMGDALMLLFIGGMEGNSIVWTVFCLALFVQSLAAVLLLILKKANKQTALPFIPFLLVGRLILLIW